ncbi:MAG: hypothetical protein ACI9G1_000223 [Pirellulaceae bacterium]|jgi:hypothetical protein
MNRMFTTAVLLAAALSATVVDAQTGMKIIEFDKEKYLRQMNPEELHTFRWAVYRPIILRQDVNYYSENRGSFVGGRSMNVTNTSASRLYSSRSYARMAGDPSRVAVRSGRPHPYNYGPIWLARRAGDYHYSSNYQIFHADGSDFRQARVRGFSFMPSDPPPALYRYWTDRKRPDWFNDRVYRLFVPYKETGWWAQRDSGEWDIIDKQQVTEEDVATPGVSLPEFRFRGPY